MSTPNFWTTNQVIFLNKLKLQCLEYSEFNRKQVKKYTTTNTHFNIPILVLSGLNSFVALGLQNFIKQDYISITNSILSLTCGILSSTALYMKYNEKINTCIACSHELNDLHATIFKELCLDENSRSMDGKDFCNKMFDEYTKIMQKHLVPKHKLYLHLLPDIQVLNEKEKYDSTINNIITPTSTSKIEQVSQSSNTEFTNLINTEIKSNVYSNDIEKSQKSINEINSSKKSFSLFGMFST